MSSKKSTPSVAEWPVPVLIPLGKEDHLAGPQLDVLLRGIFIPDNDLLGFDLKIADFLRRTRPWSQSLCGSVEQVANLTMAVGTLYSRGKSL